MRACVVFLVVFLVVGTMGCGRSAQPEVPCPVAAADCAGLAAQRVDIEAAYAAASVEGGSAIARDEAGACSVVLTQAALDGACVEDVCVELCRLHPCALVDDGTDASCEARCAALSGDEAVAVLVPVAVANAAEEPGLCTCRGCSAADDVLCTQLFDCAPVSAE